VLRNVVRYGDGWAPQYAPDEVWRRIPQLQEMAAGAGRGTIPVMMGQIPEDRAVIEQMMEIDGLERLVFSATSERAANRIDVRYLNRDETLRKIDQLGELIAPYLN
jgi:hypothetical protein